MSAWVTVKTFTNRPEAEMAKDILEQNDIPSVILSDDSGGMYPGLAAIWGVQLKVQESDLAEARSLLDQEPSESSK